MGDTSGEKTMTTILIGKRTLARFRRGMLGTVALITTAICLAASGASGGTITDTTTNGGYGGTGFGNILSLLVLHANGSEFGSATWNGSALVKTDDATNQSDVQSAATLAANGHGATFPLVLNLSEQGNAADVTIHDFTLRFYAADGSTLFDIVYDLPDAGQVLTDSGGAGQSGRVFTVALSAGESTSFYANGNNRLGMLVTEANAFEDTGGGPDNFYVPKSEENIVAESVPEPATWILAALGACSLGAIALQRQSAYRRVTQTKLMNNLGHHFQR